MKKTLFLIAVALMMTACGQQDDKSKNQADNSDNKGYIVPPGVPVAPMATSPISNAGQNEWQQNPQAPVLTMEEGKPLDLSQLMGQRQSLGEQVASKIDTIRLRAEQGKADFQYLYGASYEYGWGVEPNIKEAYKWYMKAADQKQVASYNAIGNLYRTGNGVKQDAEEALRWYRLGADGGDAQDMLNVGNCYYFGMGIDKDIASAVKWWTQSADNGNAYALAQMGDCYYFGLGVTKDLSKAVEYYTPAADKNITSAQYRLGLMYYTGEGVEQDKTYCKLLMSKARDGGMTEAQAFLEKNFD